jgi:hypothetical protein
MSPYANAEPGSEPTEPVYWILLEEIGFHGVQLKTMWDLMITKMLEAAQYTPGVRLCCWHIDVWAGSGWRWRLEFWVSVVIQEEIGLPFQPLGCRALLLSPNLNPSVMEQRRYNSAFCGFHQGQVPIPLPSSSMAGVGLIASNLI